MMTFGCSCFGRGRRASWAAKEKRRGRPYLMCRAGLWRPQSINGCLSRGAGRAGARVVFEARCRGPWARIRKAPRAGWLKIRTKKEVVSVESDGWGRGS